MIKMNLNFETKPFKKNALQSHCKKSPLQCELFNEKNSSCDFEMKAKMLFIMRSMTN